MKKIKRQNKKRKTSHRSKRTKKYSADYLLAILFLVIMVEIVCFNTTTAADWQHGLALLDMNDQVQETSQSLAFATEPISLAAQSFREIYSYGIQEVGYMFATSELDPLFVVSGINDFYKAAADEMISVLDLSEYSYWPSQVAGAVIE